VSAQLPYKDDAGKGSSVTFAASTTSAAAGFIDIASIASAAKGDEQQVALNGTRARWVRVTANRTGTGYPFQTIGAFGTIAPPPAPAVSGTYVAYDKPYAQGAFAAAPSDADP